MRGRYKRFIKRFFTGSLAVMLAVVLNINPLATLASAVVDSGVVDKFGILKDNLIYMATNNLDAVEAADDNATPCTCNIDEVVAELQKIRMQGEWEDGGELDSIRSQLTQFRAENYEWNQDLYNMGVNGFTTIHTDLKAFQNSVETHFGIVEAQLEHIQEQLDMINENIDSMQHNYRVAHLYSLNSEFPNALWRPYTQDVPYVKDFATVMGQFANVYSGYWDTAITEMDRPGTSKAERALEVLGYDAIMRYEGVILTDEVAPSDEVNAESRQLNVGFLGDSITTFEGYIPEGYAPFYPSGDEEDTAVDEVEKTWWAQVIMGGLGQAGNSSYSGCYTLPYEGEDADTTGYSDGRLEMLKTAEGTNPDIIVIYLGTNDCNAAVVDGGRFTLTKDEKQQNGSEMSFEEAYEKMLQKVEAAYPSAYVFCCTMPYQDWGMGGSRNSDGMGHTNDEYNEVIKSAAMKYQCSIVDFASLWGEGELQEMTLDGVHPNKNGMEKMSEATLNAIERANIIGHVNSGMGGATTVMNKPKGQSGEHESYDITGNTNPRSLAVLYQEEIPQKNVTWLDAVTVLYKAVGQPLYTYQTFQTYNSRITPETSPAYQGFSNIVPDEAGRYEGYDFYMFLNRNNPVYGTVNNYTMVSSYWTKALNERFVARSTDMNSPITVSEFYILATKMMQAYGEPVMNQDEIKALLQVYGSEYPVQLGFEIADAWAYLKVRGCLNSELVPSGYLDRNDLLDICMCIADEDSRSDYKNIDVVLNLSDVLRDDGYYPVYDLNFSVGAFSVTESYDYSTAKDWTYLIAKQDGFKLSETGMMIACNSTNPNDRAMDVSPSASIIEIDNLQFYVVHASKERTKPFYIGMINSVENQLLSGDITWIEIPSNCLVGGFFTGGYTKSGSTGVVSIKGTNWYPLDWQSNNPDIVYWADKQRAGGVVNQNQVASNASNASIRERIGQTFNTLFEPMQVKAAQTSSLQTSKIAYNDDTVNLEEKDRFGTGVPGSMSTTKPVADAITAGALSANSNVVKVAASNDTLFLNRLAYVAYSSDARVLLKSGNTMGNFAEVFYDADHNTHFNPMSSVPVRAEGAGLHYWLNQSSETIEKWWAGGGDMSNPHLRKVKTNRDAWLMLYATGAAPLEILATPATSQNSGVVEFGDLHYPAGESQDGKDIVTLLQNSKEVDEKVMQAVKEYDTKVTATTTGYKVESTDSSAIADLIGSCGMAENAQFESNVATSMIMSRENQMLFSWEDLVQAGIVYPMSDGGQPKKHEDDGAYYFMTTNGQIKVNEDKKTIQVGTTLYDLAYNEQESPTLVYIDTEQNNTMYFDVRCVMGIMTNSFTRNDTKTETLRNNLGGGTYVVYDIAPNGITNDRFTQREILTFNFPEISEVDWAEKAPAEHAVGYNSYIIGTTGWDGEEYTDIDGNTTTYWPDGKDYSRYNLSSFSPTANWITVIDDNGSTVEASLFVYYPMVAFDTAKGGGYDNDGDGTIDGSVSPPSDADTRWSDLSSKISDLKNAKASDGTKVVDTVLGVYGVTDISSAEWYVKMSVDAALDLFQMTGRYYVSPDFVIREFNIKDNTATVCAAWDLYNGTRVDQWPTSALQHGDDLYRYEEGGNAVGAIYWLETIGYVYNMPSTEEFTLEKYFKGEYPLPLAYDYNQKYGKPAALINFNMNFYGVGVKRGNVEGDVIPYGWVLSDHGYIHYTSTKDNEKILQGYARDDLPEKDEEDAGTLIYPFRTNDTDTTRGIKLAPTGIYFTFGGNTIYNTRVSNINTYNTKVNSFYYGNSRITLNTVGTSNSNAKFNFVSTEYSPIELSADDMFFRVWQGRSSEAWINRNPSIKSGTSDATGEIMSEDWLPDGLANWLDGLGSNDLVAAIDKGSSWLIILSFQVLPMIGIILMTILVGLSFLSDNKVVQAIVEKTVDPIRILTFGGRDIYHWHWKKVLVPCILLYISFALFLNGNLIRVIMFLAKWYDIVLQWARSVF